MLFLWPLSNLYMGLEWAYIGFRYGLYDLYTSPERPYDIRTIQIWPLFLVIHSLCELYMNLYNLHTSCIQPSYNLYISFIRASISVWAWHELMTFICGLYDLHMTFTPQTGFSLMGFLPTLKSYQKLPHPQSCRFFTVFPVLHIKQMNY